MHQRRSYLHSLAHAGIVVALSQWLLAVCLPTASSKARPFFAHHIHYVNDMLLSRPCFLPQQRGMIGEERTHETMRAQLHGRDQQKLPTTAFAAPTAMSYATSTIHKNASTTAEQWSAQVVQSVCTSTRKTGNHVCRPDVCHKGSIGKKGFCRMMFWHWTRFVDSKGIAAFQCARFRRKHAH